MSHTAHPTAYGSAATDPELHGAATRVAAGDTEATIVDADPPQGPWIVTVHHRGQRMEVEADQVADLIAVLGAARDHLEGPGAARRELNRLCRNGDCDQPRTYGDYCQRCHGDVYWTGAF